MAVDIHCVFLLLIFLIFLVAALFLHTLFSYILHTTFFNSEILTIILIGLFFSQFKDIDTTLYTKNHEFWLEE